MPTLQRDRLLKPSAPDLTLDLDFVNGVYRKSDGQFAQAAFSTLLGTPTFEVDGLKNDSGDRIALPDHRWFNPIEGTFEFESYCAPAQAEGCIFSLSQGSASRFEIYREPTGVNLTILVGGATIIANTLGAVTTKYCRGLVSYKANERCSVFGGGVAGSYQVSPYYPPAIPFDLNGIGYRVRFGDAYFGVDAADRIRRIRYWATRKSDAWMQARSLVTDFTNIHVLGDSFTETEIVALLRGLYAEQYRVLTFDGVGSSTLAAQKIRFDATPFYYDRTVVILDGGLSDDTATSLSSIAAIAAHLPADKWLYIEPGVNVTDTTGTPGRIARDATVAAIASAYPSNYVTTLAAMQAANDGSGNDLADVASGLWPRSLRVAAGDMHPNTAGKTVLAGLIKAAADTAGY